MPRPLAAVAALLLLLGPTPRYALAEMEIDENVEPAAAEAAAVETGLTVEEVERLAREAAASPDLDDESRRLVAEAYQAALADVKLAGELAARCEALSREAEETPARVTHAQQQLDELQGQEPTPESDVTLSDLEQTLAKAEVTLATRKAAQAAAEAAPQTRAQRRKEVRARLAAIQEKLSALAAAPDTTGLAPGVAAARAVELRAKRLALENEAPALESELAKYDAEDAADLLRLQTDLTSRQTAFAEKRLQLLRDAIKTAREAAAEESVRKARFESIVAAPALRKLAERNQQLAETAREVAQRLAAAEQELKQTKSVYDQLNRQFKLSRAKVESVGLTSSVGALLRKQRSTLPDLGERREAVASRRDLVDETQYQLFEYEDERQTLGDVDAATAAVLAEAAPADERAAKVLEEAAREVVGNQREYLGSLIRTCNQYFDALVELDTTDQQLVTLVERYTQFIDERVLWIRSGRGLTYDFGLDPSDRRLGDPREWAGVGRRLGADVVANPGLYGLFGCLFALLLVRGVGMRRDLAAAGEAASRANCRSFEPTLRAAALTTLVSITWPGLAALAAWRLVASTAEGEFAQAIGQGLATLAVLWQPLELFRQVCRPRGLAEAHFAWPQAVTQSLRRRLRWLTLVGLPIALLSGTLMASHATHGRDALERVCFMAGMALLAVFVFRLLSPGGLLRGHIAYHAGGWVDQLQRVWPWLGAMGPVTLLGLSFAGYHYTAQVLAWRLFATACFLVGLLVLRELLMRLLLLRRRQLSMERARQRSVAEPESTAGVAGIIAASQLTDLSAHNLQTRRLVSAGYFAASVVGLWLIWVQVLPALGMLDKYPLWSTASAGAVAAAPSPMSPLAVEGAAAEITEPAPKAELVTLSDLGLAVLVTFVTFVLFRNGPGLLELSLLQKLPLDASVRYAVTTLASYAIVMVGAVTACTTIGLQWSQVQWLATALTFGLAFGLQEMFANFVAGLILLLERPIRVGDVVTVDDVTGVVSRIQMRATSITNWDRKEYIVPNKEFITGRVLNWTLSDKVNRILVNVGVAYGTDTDHARRLLLEAAENHPLVLKDPPAVASFEGFGDNSLNFVLRAFLGDLEERLDVIHDLHTAINKAFQEEGIEIAFPQRDLHIRTAPEVLAVALAGRAAATPERKGAA